MADKTTPHIPPSVTLPEITGRAVVLSIVLSVVLAAANAYLGLFAGMTARENLALGRLARKTGSSDGAVWSEEQIMTYFPRLKERMEVAADYLSGGEQQMVAVARAMSGNVRLLLLDEPFEGLAPAVILELFQVFDRLREHISIVIVEHNLDLVLALADRVFALERGAVFHEGPAAPLLTDLAYRKKILWL